MILALLMLRQPRWHFSFIDVAFWSVALIIPVAQRAYHRMGFVADLPTLSRAGLVRHLAISLGLWALVRSLYLG